MDLNFHIVVSESVKIEQPVRAVELLKREGLKEALITQNDYYFVRAKSVLFSTFFILSLPIFCFPEVSGVISNENLVAILFFYCSGVYNSLDFFFYRDFFHVDPLLHHAVVDLCSPIKIISYYKANLEFYINLFRDSNLYGYSPNFFNKFLSWCPQYKPTEIRYNFAYNYYNFLYNDYLKIKFGSIPNYYNIIQNYPEPLIFLHDKHFTNCYYDKTFFNTINCKYFTIINNNKIMLNEEIIFSDILNNYGVKNQNISNNKVIEFINSCINNKVNYLLIKKEKLIMLLSIMIFGYNYKK